MATYPSVREMVGDAWQELSGRVIREISGTFIG
jgi:hypothetical protein